MWKDSYFLLFLTLFCQFEEEFLETRDQYEKLLQGESMWNLKKSVTRLREDYVTSLKIVCDFHTEE